MSTFMITVDISETSSNVVFVNTVKKVDNSVWKLLTEEKHLRQSWKQASLRAPWSLSGNPCEVTVLVLYCITTVNRCMDFCMKRAEDRLTVRRAHGWVWEHLCPCSTKAVISNTGIFVAIDNNTLYGSKLYIFILCQKIIRILSKNHVPWRYFVNFLP